mmetsp:Transcript_55611/g.152942  ORF Transcript_55611/g.152942 Transcript_55611/m.152942 type:complete len:219 (-) Transcript_55611:30-686(-)
MQRTYLAAIRVLHVHVVTPHRTRPPTVSSIGAADTGRMPRTWGPRREQPSDASMRRPRREQNAEGGPGCAVRPDQWTRPRPWVRVGSEDAAPTRWACVCARAPSCVVGGRGHGAESTEPPRPSKRAWIHAAGLLQGRPSPLAPTHTHTGGGGGGGGIHAEGFTRRGVRATCSCRESPARGRTRRRDDSSGRRATVALSARSSEAMHTAPAGSTSTARR